jgi:hypothetical protein
LDITVPTGPVSLGSGAPGATISGQFPATPLVTVTDDRAICSHRITLAAAQTAIATDWTTALARLGLPAVR